MFIEIKNDNKSLTIIYSKEKTYVISNFKLKIKVTMCTL